ncbi:MAG: hypothetical protein Q9P14_11755 [candidate division KSB1 bacterium]|nr:hypothetical protein [candidate division KSB1 bacterium]
MRQTILRSEILPVRIASAIPPLAAYCAQAAEDVRRGIHPRALLAEREASTMQADLTLECKDGWTKEEDLSSFALVCWRIDLSNRHSLSYMDANP